MIILYITFMCQCFDQHLTHYVVYVILVIRITSVFGVLGFFFFSPGTPFFGANLDKKTDKVLFIRGVPKDLHLQFKLHCLQKGVTMKAELFRLMKLEIKGPSPFDLPLRIDL